MALPAVTETSSIIRRLHNAQFPSNTYYSSSSNWTGCATPAVAPVNWKGSATPAVAPVNWKGSAMPGVVPAPIVIAPSDAELDPGMPLTDPLNCLPQLAATSDRVEAPAVAMTTDVRGRVPRPITGRGSRDQLPVTTAADTVVCLC